MLHRLSLRGILKAAALGALLSLVVFVAPAMAAVYGGTGIQGGIDAANGVGGITNATSVSDVVVRIIVFVLDIVLILAIVAVIVAGIYLIVSNGEPAQKDKAKNIIIYVIVGIIIILLARVIVMFVNTVFG